MKNVNFIFENYRFAEQVLNSRLVVKNEFLDFLRNFNIAPGGISRPGLNEVIHEGLTAKGWSPQVPVFGAKGRGETRLDFVKDRVGVEVQFGHASFIGIDLLKFQVGSYSGLNIIDAGIYLMATHRFIREMEEAGQKWKGSLSFEKVKGYLPHFRSAIHVPILVVGLIP